MKHNYENPKIENECFNRYSNAKIKCLFCDHVDVCRYETKMIEFPIDEYEEIEEINDDDIDDENWLYINKYIIVILYHLKVIAVRPV